MLQPGAVLERGYVIERVLGQGGMGAVYLARQNTLGGRRVAIKETTLRVPDPAEQARIDAQFQREAEILASIDHPNLVDVKDYFEENGAQYLVMAFIDGETLEDVMLRSPEPLPVDQVLGWIDQLCDVLMVLHEHAPPVLVRDLKPSNVMVDSKGRIRLIDFGIARVHSVDEKTATLLKGAGSHGFAPVEQLGGGSTDARSDVYGLGATTYALLTRTPPAGSMQVAAGECELIPPSRLNAAVSPALDAVILRMMAVRRDQRYQSVREARQALRDARSTVQDSAPAVTIPRRFCTRCGGGVQPTQTACPQCGDDLARQGSSGGWPVPAPPPPPPTPVPRDDWAPPPPRPVPREDGAPPPPAPRIGTWIARLLVVAALAWAGWLIARSRPTPPVGPTPTPSPAPTGQLASVALPTPEPTPEPKPALDGCTASLTLLGSGLELYHASRGRYPNTLDELPPTYLKSLPTCPAADSNTYAYYRDTDGSAFTVVCGGWMHKDAGLPRNHPLFDSHHGLLLRNPALDLNPRTASEYLAKGEAELDAGEPRRALDLLDETVRADSKWAYAWYLIGQCQMELKAYQKAIDAYTLAIGVAGRTATYYAQRGRAYTLLGDNVNALSDFQQARNFGDGRLDIDRGLGFVYFGMDRFGDAMTVADSIIKRDPRYGPGYGLRYWCELARGDGAQAAADAQRELDLDGWRADAAPYCAIVGWLGYRAAGRPDDARAMLLAALPKLRADWPYPCLQYLGDGMNEEALLAAAGGDIEKLTEARCYLGVRAAIEGRKDDARRHLQWVRDNGPRSFFEYTVSVNWLNRL